MDRHSLTAGDPATLPNALTDRFQVTGRLETGHDANASQHRRGANAPCRENEFEKRASTPFRGIFEEYSEKTQAIHSVANTASAACSVAWMSASE